MVSSVSLADVLRRYQLTEQQLDIPCSEEHLEEVARWLNRWELLAYSLGLTKGEVTAIQEESPKDYPLQRLNSLTKWRQKKGVGATYLHLARALEKESHMDLVGELCELLSKSLEVIKESEEAMNVDSDTNEKFEDRSQQLESKLEQFEERFEQLATTTLEELEEGKVTTRRIRWNLTHLPSKIKPNHLTYIKDNIKTLKKAEDLEEIFLHLNLYWDSFNYTLLEMIVSKHGSTGLKQRMETYVSEITTFMRETTVAEYITVCGGQQRPTKKLEEFKELKCRLNKPANRCTLLEIVDLRCRFCQRLQLPEFALKLFQLEDTSVTVTWLIHEEHLFNEHSFENAELLSPDIDLISVDGQYKRLKSDVTHPAMAVKTDKTTTDLRNTTQRMASGPPWGFGIPPWLFLLDDDDLDDLFLWDDTPPREATPPQHHRRRNRQPSIRQASATAAAGAAATGGGVKVTVDEAKEMVGTIVQALKRDFEGFDVSEVVEGGALYHGTTVPSRYDADLIIYSKDISGEELREGDGNFKNWLSRLDTFLRTTFTQDYRKCRLTSRCLQFRFRDTVHLDLLVSPHWHHRQQFYHFLEGVSKEKRDNFTVCAAKWQVQFLKKQPPQVKKLIRKAKEWRNGEWPSERSQEGRPSSYLLSLLVVAAYEQDPKNVTRAIKDLVHYNIDLCWAGQFYEKQNYPNLLPARPRVVDPANPANNVWVSGFQRTQAGESPSNYEPGDGNSALLKAKIHSINLD